MRNKTKTRSRTRTKNRTRTRTRTRTKTRNKIKGGAALTATAPYSAEYAMAFETLLREVFKQVHDFVSTSTFTLPNGYTTDVDLLKSNLNKLNNDQIYFRISTDYFRARGPGLLYLDLEIMSSKDEDIISIKKKMVVVEDIANYLILCNDKQAGLYEK